MSDLSISSPSITDLRFQILNFTPSQPRKSTTQLLSTKDTRTTILKAAWELLEQGQGQSVRMIDIARAAHISRQALYLHFASQSELFVATAKYVDEVKEIDKRLAPSRTAKDGQTRLMMFVEFWGKYLPEIYGVVKAVQLARNHDPSADAAWQDRMKALRQGCRAVIDLLVAEGKLISELNPAQATDLLWSSLSVSQWEHLTQDCHWSQKQYIQRMQNHLLRALCR